MQQQMKQTFKVIIAGSRKYTDYSKLKQECDKILSNKIQEFEVVIVSGGASGADALGERYATERGLNIEHHPADWNKNGRAAGPIRNAEMASVSDALIAFPKLGEANRGTINMINVAKSKGLLVRVIAE